MTQEGGTLITEQIVDKAVAAFCRGSYSSNLEQAIRESMTAALRAVEGDIVEAFGASGTPMTVEGAEDDELMEFGETVGYCSKCGEVREAFYTCRNGGETIPKEAEQ